MVPAVGELVCFSLWLLCREAAQRITRPEAVSVGSACGMYYCYQKVFLGRLLVSFSRNGLGRFFSFYFAHLKEGESSCVVFF